MYKIDNIDAACRHVGYMVPLWLTDLMDSAFATASAQGQLKGVRPCQSIQECWQTVQTCVCVFVRGLGSTRWAVSWPKPQPDFINHGRKRAQPLTLGLKTWLSTFLPCLLLRLGARSASFSSHLALPFTISHCLLADNSGRVYSTEDFKGGNDWTQECHVVRKASFFFFFKHGLSFAKANLLFASCMVVIVFCFHRYFKFHRQLMKLCLLDRVKEMFILPCPFLLSSKLLPLPRCQMLNLIANNWIQNVWIWKSYFQGLSFIYSA